MGGCGSFVYAGRLCRKCILAGKTLKSRHKSKSARQIRHNVYAGLKDLDTENGKHIFDIMLRAENIVAGG